MILVVGKRSLVAVGAPAGALSGPLARPERAAGGAVAARAPFFRPGDVFQLTRWRTLAQSVSASVHSRGTRLLAARLLAALRGGRGSMFMFN